MSGSALSPWLLSTKGLGGRMEVWGVQGVRWSEEQGPLAANLGLLSYGPAAAPLEGTHPAPAGLSAQLRVGAFG